MNLLLNISRVFVIGILFTVSECFAATLPDTVPGSYVLRRGDLMEITVMQNPEFTVSGVLIMPDGNIQYPGLGSIRAAGLTIDEFTQLITTITQKYIVDPIVTVFVRSLPNQVMNVIGYVSRPGQITIFEPLDLITVLSKAGGIVNIEKCKTITIIRANQQTEVIKTRDLFSRHANKRIVPMLHVGDTVYVVEPESVNWSRLSFIVSLTQMFVYLVYIFQR